MQSYFNWKVTGVAITCSDKRHHIPVHILVCWELLKKEKQFDSKILLKNHIKGLFGLVGIGRGLKGIEGIKSLTSQNRPHLLQSPWEGINRTSPKECIAL
jgi:hypothetical protein